MRSADKSGPYRFEPGTESCDSKCPSLAASQIDNADDAGYCRAGATGTG